jgi:hypothetical protein
MLKEKEYNGLSIDSFTLDYIIAYAKMQSDMLVVHSQKPDDWKVRHTINSKDFNPLTQYNHRNILDNEIVIEFDLPKLEDNAKLAQTLVEVFNSFKLNYAVHWSGNKSYHMHLFFDISKVSDISLMKRTLIRYYTNSLGYKPDMQMAVRRHLIRMECGLHEKTLQYKKALIVTPHYPLLNKVPTQVWQLYDEERRKRIDRKVLRNADLEKLPEIETLLQGVNVKTADDGRERILFVLIHVLKGKYVQRQEELVQFLYDWYRYTGGRKLTKQQIYHKVRYHWNRTYYITQNYINNLLQDIGIEVQK